MPGLRETTARLAEYRRRFETLIGAGGAAQAPLASDHGSPRLREIAAFGSNPGNLRMLVYRPQKCPAGAPLVVVLHGCTQTAEGYDFGAGWSTLADRHGFVLLFPEQQRANNPKSCFNWFLPGDIARDRGEALSIRQMIERVAADEGIDRERVFVTGLSAGGAMAAVMLATYPEVFAGGAIIAGLPYGTAENVQEALDSMFQGKRLPAKEWGDRVRRASPYRGPWPKVSIWHGSADATVKPINADALVRQWTNVHGVSQRGAAADVVEGHGRLVWRNAAGEAVVESVTIAGMAHGTPIAAGDGAEAIGNAGPFILDVGISSSYRIAQFFGLTSGKAAKEAADAPRRRALSRPPAASEVEAARALRDAFTAREANVRTLLPLPKRAASAPPPKSGEFDPAAVIDKALRRAGLLK